MTPRNLLVFFDGTWNRAETGSDNNQTNVEKIYRLLPDSCSKSAHYEEGVGVKSEEEILGGIFGAGIDERILGAYRFLQSRYADQGFENRLFIFGFSRGAYTARTFAQLLYYCGVPAKNGKPRRAWDCYYNQDLTAAGKLKRNGDFFDVDIDMLGVWDTVKSTLDPDRKDTTLYPNVKAAYHAMAIDEKRRNFPVLRFDEDPRVSQVWFAGVHSDVGGGYKSGESRLSDIALEWMVSAARNHGLEFIADAKDYMAPSPTGKIHDSYEGKWKLLGETIRRIEDRDNIHSSVKDRLAGISGYHPVNLPTNPHFI
ncbi:MAG: DUF2235 domain-containing protein [Pontiellaceae bacterium]|jgi:uncharacterized protein (DUF2235 family)|nr:DUF2235 domain-containing protein [Pontiellaceae bacterium]